MAMLKGADSVEHAQPNLHSGSVPKNSDKAQKRAELVDLEIVISLHSYIYTHTLTFGPACTNSNEKSCPIKIRSTTFDHTG